MIVAVGVFIAAVACCFCRRPKSGRPMVDQSFSRGLRHRLRHGQTEHEPYLDRVVMHPCGFLVPKP